MLSVDMDHVQVPEWSVAEVVMWVNKAGFKDYSDAFLQSEVDGDILLMLTDANIRDDIGIKNGILRKRFLRELKKLKKNADYSCSEGGTTSNFLARISPDFRSYTYNLISHDLTYDYMLRLDPVSLEDMLKYAGVDSAIHRHKIVEAVCNEMDEESSLVDASLVYMEPATTSMTNSVADIDVYISYPKAGGAELASLIAMQMQLRGLSVVTDAHDAACNSAGVNDALLAQVRRARAYVIVLPAGGLNACLHPAAGGHNSRLHAELVAAQQAECNIIPVTCEFRWPDASDLPEEIRPLCHFNGVAWVHDYQDACCDKLEKFIRQEPSLSSGASVRADSPVTLSGIGRSGRSTPRGSTPCLVSPYLKQRGIPIGGGLQPKNRTMSIDSAIGSASLL